MMSEAITSRPGPAAEGDSALIRALRKFRITLEMIKFEHSIFALPFALVGAMLAARGWPEWRQIFWLTVAMVAARSAAMTFNRIVDRRIDALNPRTQSRALPAGKLGLPFAAAFTAASCAILALSAYMLNRLAFELSPLAIAVILGYSYCKRFTELTHLALGIADGLSPVAAWIAIRGDVSVGILLLGGAVALWVAGFDLIYACQDLDFDRAHGIHSMPQRFGVSAALYTSVAFHVLMVALLVAVIEVEHLGVLALAGTALVAGLLAYEHWLVRPSDLSRLNAAFFTINGYVSILFFITWGADLLVHR